MGDFDDTGVNFAILWDVMEEHLDEAEFLSTTWHDALLSPRYTLAEVARGPEQRWRAHLEALRIGGPEVAKKVLLPLLEAPEEPTAERSLAAALVLMASGRPEPVWAALTSEEELVRYAASEAFELDAPGQFDGWVSSQFADGAPPLPSGQCASVLRIAARRGLRVPSVLESMKSSHVGQITAAVEAARFSDPARHLAAIEQLVDHEDDGIRDASLVTGLCFGSLHAWQRCLTQAASTQVVNPLAMLLISLLGEPGHHAVLTGHLARSTHRRAALKALAYCGQASTIPSIIPYLSSQDPIVAALASFAFAMITGIDTSEDAYVASEPGQEPEGLPDLEDDDLDADLVPGAEEDLAPPNPGAIEAVWRLRAPTLDTRHRLLAGHRWTLATCLERLDGASMFAREPLALWLLVRTAGVGRIATRSWSSVQLAQLAHARSLTEHALVRRYGAW